MQTDMASNRMNTSHSLAGVGHQAGCLLVRLLHVVLEAILLLLPNCIQLHYLTCHTCSKRTAKGPTAGLLVYDRHHHI